MSTSHITLSELEDELMTATLNNAAAASAASHSKAAEQFAAAALSCLHGIEVIKTLQVLEGVDA